MIEIILPQPPPKGDKWLSSLGGGVPRYSGTEEEWFSKFRTHHLSFITI